ncbi:MAG TPA: hypothetical protein VJ183_11850 [Chloroflexia bacterium]|nr:hypothetical protein [Chloroflexia bacterium]
MAVAYNWKTEEETPVSQLPYRFCPGRDVRWSDNGLYEQPPKGRFCLPEPGPGVNIAAYIGEDCAARSESRSLIAISSKNPNDRYIVKLPDCTDKYFAQYELYFSSDAGVTSELRQKSALECLGFPGHEYPAFVDIKMLPGAPTDMLLMYYWNGGHSPTKILLSSDGGHNFLPLGQAGGYEGWMSLIYTHEGLLRVCYPPGQILFSACNPDKLSSPVLSLTRDGGQTWEYLTGGPFSLSWSTPFAVSYVARANLFASEDIDQKPDRLWYSQDGGHNWQQVMDPIGSDALFLDALPYLPITALGTNNNHLYTLDLPDAGKHLADRSAPDGAPGNRYFPETGHNLFWVFKEYWDAHGGLPQQGYPITELLLEVNDTDGKVYTTQYFERAVFELHPKHQPPNNVLLSLLGVFEYARKYPGGAPEQVPNTSLGSVLFPETGKMLGGKFLEYWQTHGGLRQQGYPISNEFREKSELDGKTYTVQYFERAVFELHPENAGTAYEVLLSQLGTVRLKGKYGAEVIPVP